MKDLYIFSHFLMVAAVFLGLYSDKLYPRNTRAIVIVITILFTLFAALDVYAILELHNASQKTDDHLFRYFFSLGLIIPMFLFSFFIDSKTMAAKGKIVLWFLVGISALIFCVPFGILKYYELTVHVLNYFGHIIATGSVIVGVFGDTSITEDSKFKGLTIVGKMTMLVATVGLFLSVLTDLSSEDEQERLNARLREGVDIVDKMSPTLKEIPGELEVIKDTLKDLNPKLIEFIRLITELNKNANQTIPGRITQVGTDVKSALDTHVHRLEIVLTQKEAAIANDISKRVTLEDHNNAVTALTDNKLNKQVLADSLEKVRESLATKAALEKASQKIQTVETIARNADGTASTNKNEIGKITSSDLVQKELLLKLLETLAANDSTYLALKNQYAGELKK